MKLKAVVILVLIIGSLLPAYALYRYLRVKMKPEKSGSRFLLWLLANFILIFVYTFLVVFIINLLFRKP